MRSALLLAAAAATAAPPPQTWLDAPPGPHDDFDLFRMGDLGFSHFRIPVLATIEGPTPALVLVVEARKFSFMDWGTRGLVIRTSHDGGRSWTPSAQIVTDPRANNVTMELAGHGLDGIAQISSVLVDSVANKLILMFSPCEENCSAVGGNVGAVGGGASWDAYSSSCLRGETRAGNPFRCGSVVQSKGFTITADTSRFPLRWGPPIEFTKQLSPTWRTWTAGPSAGIQMRAGGPNPGRLIACGWIIDEGLRRPKGYDPQGYSAGSAIIYSDDHGAQWHSGGTIDVCFMLQLTNCSYGRKATDECQPVELTNGSVLVTLRSEWEGDGHRRSQARSDDGGLTFVDWRLTDIPDNGNTGAIVRHGSSLLMSNAYDPADRANLSVSQSTDEGESFHPVVTVNPGGSGYSSIANLPKAFGTPNSVAVVYERSGSFCPAGWASVGCCENASHIDVTGKAGTLPSAWPGNPQSWVGSHCTGWNVASLALAIVDLPPAQGAGAPKTTSLPRSPAPAPARRKPAAMMTSQPDFLNIAQVCCLAGWPHCNSTVSPNTAGAFEQFDFVAVPLPPNPTTSGTEPAPLASLFTQAWPTRLSSGKTLPNLAALFGQGASPAGGGGRFVPSELVQMSTVNQPLSTPWDLLAKEGAAFAVNHTIAAAAAEVVVPPLLDRYSRQLCEQLHSTGDSWWFFDVSIPMDIMRHPGTGVGIAQVLRYVKEQCAALSPAVALKVVWSSRSAIGHDSYMTQAYVTQGLHGGSAESSSVTDLADLIVVRTDDPSLAVGVERFAYSNAPYSGECFVTPGADNALDEWVKLAWKRGVPARKLLMGDTPISTAIGDCAAEMGPDEIEPCMLADRCQRFRFVPGDDGGNSQQELYRAVERGTVSYSYDVWAQQAHFAGHMTTNDGHVLQWVDTGTAQEYDFKLRHLAWRGVGGRVSFCAESDFTHTAPSPAEESDGRTRPSSGGHHWTQPADVFAEFRKSEVYMVRAEDASGKQLTSLICSSCRAWQPNQPWCNPPECLPLPNADAICRVFGGRLATTDAVERAANAGASWTADAILQNRTFIDGPLWATTPTCTPTFPSGACSNFRGTVAAHPSGGKLVYGAHLTSSSDTSVVSGRVLCFGVKPSRPEDFAPFRSEGWNSTHFSMHSSTSSKDSTSIGGGGKGATLDDQESPNGDKGEVTAAAQPEVFQISVKTRTARANQSILDASFQREVPITPRLAAAIAEVLGVTIANSTQVEAAAAEGAQWCSPGLTAIEWPTFRQFSPLTAGTFPYNSTAPRSNRCVLPVEVDTITVAKVCADPQCKNGSITTGRVAALNKKIFDLGLATLDFATLSDATGLSAVNMFGVKPAQALFNSAPGNPFAILPFSPSRWSQWSPSTAS